MVKAETQKEHPLCGEQLIESLQDLQQSHGYLPEELLREIAVNLDVPLIEVFRVVSFYKSFSTEPKGLHQITICNGTACHVRGSGRLVEELQSILGIGPGATTEDGQFSLETVNCVGCCALGPMMSIDDEAHGNLSITNVKNVLARYKEEDSYGNY